MLSANQTTGFLNQLYIKNKAMKKPDFLHVDTDSWETEVSYKNIGLSIIRNGWDHSVFKALKVTVCQGTVNEIN